MRKYRIPGRINFIGEHTDYNNGYVFPGAVNLGLDMTVTPRQGERHRFYSQHFDQGQECDLDGTGLSFGWTVFFHQVLQLMKEKNMIVGAIDCSFGGDLPIGAGMSSSSAITCGLIYALNDLFKLSLSRLDIVKLASEAERGSGLDGGYMDQYAITMGEENSLLLLDCRSLTHESVTVDFNEYGLVLFDTKVTHSLIDSGYNDRHEDCKRGLRVVKQYFPQVETVRDITQGMLEQTKLHMDDISLNRLAYVIAENERVLRCKKLLKEKDIDRLGMTLLESHAGLRDLYEVSCPELDFIVEICESERYVAGARMMGGGFGGCVIALVKKSEVTSVFQKIAVEYEKSFRQKPDLHIVKVGPGIRRVL